jgi:multisubunit Na+/H+ antiporter MnhF subunit
MTEIVKTAADISMLGLFVTAALCIYRLAVGPDAANRAVAADVFTMALVGMVCVMSVRWHSSLYFDVVWILTLVGFLGSATVARYLARGRIF